MGGSVARCAEPVLSIDLASRQHHRSLSPTTADAPLVSSSSSEDLGGEEVEYDGKASQSSDSEVMGKDEFPMEAFRSLQPVHQARSQGCGALRGVVHARASEVAELRRCFASASYEEAALRGAVAKLREEFGVAEAEAEEEADVRKFLLSELAEREKRGTGLQKRWTKAGESGRILAADFANLREDVAALRSEMDWARRYRTGAAARRMVLEAELCEAERTLRGQAADHTTTQIAGVIAGAGFVQDLKAEEAAEAREACRARRSTERLAELQAHLDAMRLRLMQEEHMRSCMEQHVNALQLGLSFYHGRR